MLWMAVLVSLGVLVAPGVYAKYIANAQGNATARIAAFDISGVKHSGFGKDELLYYHKAYTAQQTNYYIEAKNNSEVTVRAKLRFFNVLRDDGTIASGYNWWLSPDHRRMLLDNVNIFNGTAPPAARANTWNGSALVNGNTAYPRIRNVRTANASGTAYSPTAPQYYNATAGANEGACMEPGETVRFYFDLSHELYRQGMSPDTNIHTIDDYAGDGTFDAVFRINFDLIATQID